MRATIQDIHEWDWQDVRLRSTGEGRDMSVKGYAFGRSGSLCNSH